MPTNHFPQHQPMSTSNTGNTPKPSYARTDEDAGASAKRPRGHQEEEGQKGAPEESVPKQSKVETQYTRIVLRHIRWYHVDKCWDGKEGWQIDYKRGDTNISYRGPTKLTEDQLLRDWSDSMALLRARQLLELCDFPEWQCDKRIVLAAVQMDVNNFQYASEELQKDVEIIAALQQHHSPHGDLDSLVNTSKQIVVEQKRAEQDVQCKLPAGAPFSSITLHTETWTRW